MVKHTFEKPEFEIIRFSSNVIITSTCGCDCGLLGPQDDDCKNDDPAKCSCEVNYIAGTANCIPCDSYNS